MPPTQFRIRDVDLWDIISDGVTKRFRAPEWVTLHYRDSKTRPEIIIPIVALNLTAEETLLKVQTISNVLFTRAA